MSPSRVLALLLLTLQFNLGFQVVEGVDHPSVRVATGRALTSSTSVQGICATCSVLGAVRITHD
jgi:hypothetical protein